MFHLANIVGWAAFVLFDFLVKISLGGFNPSNIFGVLLLAISGIIFSEFFRYIFYRLIKNAKAGFLLYSKVLILHLLTVTIETAIPIYLLVYYFDQSLLNSATDIYISNAINMLFMQSIWLGFFLWIKSYMQLKRQEQEKLQLEIQLSKAQMNVLIGQINPHFMFNSLNNIRSLMLIDVEKSRDMITSLADVLRYSLNSNKNTKTILSEEIEVVHHFIDLAKIQYGNRLQFQIHIPFNLTHAFVPTMMIQQLVENAVKHGVALLKEESSITVNIKDHNQQLSIEITNHIPVTMVNKSESTFIGHKNIQDRLNILYSHNAKFQFIVENQIAKVLIHIPLEFS